MTRAPRRRNYITSTLRPDERLHAIGVFHPGIFVWPAICALLILLIGGILPSYCVRAFGVPEPIAFVFSLVFYAMAIIPIAQVLSVWLSTETAITSARVVLKKGVIAREAHEISIGKIETFTLDQSIIGRLLGFGTVKIIGTGGHCIEIAGLTDPLAFRDVLQDVIASNTTA